MEISNVLYTCIFSFTEFVHLQLLSKAVILVTLMCYEFSQRTHYYLVIFSVTSADSTRIQALEVSCSVSYEEDMKRLA